MRVLVLSHLYPSRAQPTKGIFVHRQVIALTRAGIDVMVVAPVPSVPPGAARFGNYRFYSQVPPADVIDGIRIVYPRYPQPPRNVLNGLATLLFARALASPALTVARAFRPDLIHSHLATPDGFAGWRIAGELRIPLVCSLRGSDVNVSPHRGARSLLMTKKVLEGADRVTAVSDALRREAQKLVKRTIEVVYTGLDSERFYPDAAMRTDTRTELAVDEDVCVFGFVGNLIREKGVYDLLDAFARVVSTGYPALLLFVGDGAERVGLDRRARHLRLQERVVFTGSVPHDQVPRFLNAVDVMVLPSYREGLPNVIVEAMACQKAVIATRVGGIGEVVEHERTGLLVNASDLTGLANACLRQAADADLRRKLAAEGRRAVVRRFSWEQNASGMIAVYTDLLGAHQCHSASWTAAAVDGGSEEKRLK